VAIRGVLGAANGSFVLDPGSDGPLSGAALGALGTPFCSAVANSSGLPAAIAAFGSEAATDDDLVLHAVCLPEGQFGYFLASQTQAQPPVTPPGRQGVLCLAGNIGRYTTTAQIIQGPTGSIQVDLTSIPVNPPTAVLPGDTWNFQCWYRDNNPGPTSNFTDAVSVTSRIGLSS
jgi:hypothetical protein